MQSPARHARMTAGQPASIWKPSTIRRESHTVADSMRRQGLQGRRPKHRKGLTRQDAKAPKFPDLVHRNFTAMAPNVRWCGDVTEIPTDEGKLYLATVLDLFSRKLLACPTSAHPDAELMCDAIKIATAVRWPRRGRRGRVSHRPRIDLHRKEFHRPVRASRGTPVDGPGRVVSTMPPRRRSSPPWSTRCCPGTISPPGLRLAPSWSPGALTSTTPDGGIAPPDCGHQ